MNTCSLTASKDLLSVLSDVLISYVIRAKEVMVLIANRVLLIPLVTLPINPRLFEKNHIM